ncbi:MAG: hypothetical protein RL154_688, partial [Pseudomonadota bacterium]
TKTATTQTSQSLDKTKDVLNSSEDELIQKVKDGSLNSQDIVTAYQMNYMAQAAVEDAGTPKAQDKYDYNKIMGILQGLDLSKTGYTGPELSQISKEDAQKLVSEDGFFGVKKTSERMSDFVINGAGDDLKKLQQGREGIISGYKEAEAMWGGKLPDISKKTLDATLAKIDKKIESLGGNAIDATA